ncbi:endocuticle structural glycoprotein SgAbd-3-like [Frankliniella occidentalis]|uniref:Endocuticle structural glycoprotein SgAbd-3-like n=1 Tax=Frankliniella occidentalis TaxID=133901 RepID=A0A6J1S309_FRAOC|nr:endocuticle structural glycoprotein SgAbd-3-like [Frankliniella occidentalis]
MRSVLMVFAVLAVVAARPQQQQQLQQRPIAILSQDAVVNSDGSFHSRFETEDGVRRQEVGQLRQLGGKDVAEVVQGQVQYSDREGNQYDLRFTADENGYHPEGAHLPQPPPIPAEIQRSIEYNLAHPEEDESQKYTS